MEPSARKEQEQRIRELSQRGAVGQAVGLALELYGPEFMRLLGSILRDPERTRDAFNDLGEHLLTDLPSFRWECSFRTWAYQVARHIAYRMAASPVGREQPMSHGAFSREPQPERTWTHPWFQTTVKERFRVLREQLTPHEQALLRLRVDRRLSWFDVARELADPGEALTPAVLQRRAAVLRQQFQRIKERLRELAREEQLLSSQDAPPSST
jgi:RNA polymerase sigma-70 factor (ECF subfamily)